jgi:uncharacterized protein
MQSSMFNVRVPLQNEGGVFLLNTFTDAQAIVPDDVAELLDRLESVDPRDLSCDEREALRELSENGFVVEDRAGEREAVEAYFREVREDTDLLRVTVLTTLQCNFACNYCYQGDHADWNTVAEKMSLETAESVGDWLEDRLNDVRPQKFALMFFGGEPLLNLPVIYYLSERMDAACRALGVEMTITMVTNGLLLTREIVSRLRPLGLAGIKVTLDGDRETHNRLRPLRGGQGTFDRIVHNIRQVADLCTISIGGNFDEKTAGSYPALLQFLREQSFAPSIAKVVFKPIIRDGAEARREQRREDPQRLKVIPLIPVGARQSEKPLNGTCMTVAGSGASSACDSCNLLDEKMSWLREETKRYGFPTIDGVHMGPCEIHRDQSHTIGPDGALYACPGFTGDRGQAVGHIDGRQSEAQARTASAFERLAAWKECHDCAFIPVCAGGCTVAAHAEFGDINKPNCHKMSFEEGVVSMARDAAAAAAPAAPALAS